MVWFLGCWHLPTSPDSKCSFAVWHRVLSLRVAKISESEEVQASQLHQEVSKSTKIPVPCSRGRQRDGAAMGWMFSLQAETAAGMFPQMGSGPFSGH